MSIPERIATRRAELVKQLDDLHQRATISEGLCALYARHGARAGGELADLAASEQSALAGYVRAIQRASYEFNALAELGGTGGRVEVTAEPVAAEPQQLSITATPPADASTSTPTTTHARTRR